MIRQAQELIQLVVVQGGPEENRTEKSQVLNGDSGIGLTSSHPTASKAFSDFEVGCCHY